MTTAFNPAFAVRREVTLSGHLLDSLTLAKVLDLIEAMGGDYALNALTIGQSRREFSFASIEVAAADNAALEAIVAALQPHLDKTPFPSSDCRQGRGAALAAACEASPLKIGASPLGAPQTPKVLMCAPDYFTIEYAINPWMSVGGACDGAMARQQWEALAQAIEAAGAQTLRLQPVAGLPDLVFTANAAFVYGDCAIIAHYKFPERQGEEPHVQRWFQEQGFRVATMAPGIHFEGAGDALIWRDRVFAGYKTRSALASHSAITAQTGLPVLSLELIDPRFYHIDVCLCPLRGGHTLFYPGAFDDWGQSVVRANIPPELLIEVTPEEAADFACNAVNIDDAVILNRPSARLREILGARGFNVVGLDMSEFLKSGGSCKCLTLRVG
ncbi:MAG: hypothetical protein IPK79_10005 [Vampirovibrionales bacterium]|nr:hypothetical protein [Vampirovibrionales bacterium]